MVVVFLKKKFFHSDMIFELEVPVLPLRMLTIRSSMKL